MRAGRFIARKVSLQTVLEHCFALDLGLTQAQNWIVCGSDDFQLRVYNYNTSEKVTTFEAHPDCKLSTEYVLDTF